MSDPIELYMKAVRTVFADAERDAPHITREQMITPHGYMPVVRTRVDNRSVCMPDTRVRDDDAEKLARSTLEMLPKYVLVEEDCDDEG